MHRFFIVSLLSAFGVIGVAAECALVDTQQRTIIYDPDIAIADRLRPDDKDVVVVKRLLPPLTANPSTVRSFDEEISRLRRSETAAVVKVRDIRGDLSDQGTWIRTRITADIDRIIYSSGPPAGQSIEFGFAAGRTMVGAVTVTAGTFPQYKDGERYLVFLSTDPGIKGMFPSTAFHLSADGLLERLRDNRGEEQSTRTNLVGLNISDVVQALERAK